MKKNEKQTFLKTSIIVIITTFLMKAVGLVREIALSYYFGAGVITDAYNVALTVPATLFEYVTFGISIAYIPIFTNISHRHGEKKAFNFSSSLIVSALIIVTLLNCILQFFTPWVVKIFASGFSGAIFERTILFTRIISWNIYFLIIADIFCGYLQVKDKYIIAVLASLPYNFVIISSILIAYEFNADILAMGVPLAAFAELIFVGIFAVKSGYKFTLNANFEGMSEFINLVIPVIAIVISEQINGVIDKTIASGILVGGISILAYADKINSMLRQLLARPLAMLLYPKLCMYAAQNDKRNMGKIITKGLKSIVVLIIPIMCSIQILAEPVVSILFGHGAFSEDVVKLTAQALALYSIGLIGYSAREIMSRALYAIEDSKAPMFNSILCVITNIILNIILSRFMGIMGLALATSISGIVSAVQFYFILGTKFGKNNLEMKSFYITSLKTVLSTIIMASILFIINYFLLNDWAKISLFIIAGIVYYVIGRIMRIEEINELTIFASSFFRSKKKNV